MFSSQSAELSLESPCKAVTAVRADRHDSRFLVGTCSIRQQQQPNHLHVVRFHSEVNELGIDASIAHPTGPVSLLQTSPIHRTLVMSVAEQSTTATLWKLPQATMEETAELEYDLEETEEDDRGKQPGITFNLTSANNNSSHVMEKMLTLQHDDQPSESSRCLTDMIWRSSLNEEEDAMPPSSAGEIVTLDESGGVTQWDISQGSAQSIRFVTASAANDKTQLTRPRMAWDPHSVDALAVSVGTSVRILDWRVDTSIPSGTVDSFQAHRYGVSDVDYNPNKPHVLATAGQDGLLKFWDLRNAASPLLIARGGHSHWLSNVSYNPFHDQLVISSGTDAMVNLWRVSSISSAPLLTLDDEDDYYNATSTTNDENMANGANNTASTSNNNGGNKGSAPNVRVESYEHGDSCYGACWSAADAWVYVSLGYDGRMVLNHVPSKEKYKILL